jgi:hypothetical protein
MIHVVGYASLKSEFFVSSSEVVRGPNDGNKGRGVGERFEMAESK